VDVPNEAIQSPQRLNRVSARDQAHIRPDHHIVTDDDVWQGVECAVLIEEDRAPIDTFLPRRTA
jgi:hypothetical protein